MKCYLGRWQDKKIGLCVDPGAFIYTYPTDFKQVYEYLCLDYPFTNIWTNNPYIVDLFSANDIIVYCRKDDIYYETTLNNHPRYEQYSKEFSNGEIWSLEGVEWIIDEKYKAKPYTT